VGDITYGAESLTLIKKQSNYVLMKYKFVSSPGNYTLTYTITPGGTNYYFWLLVLSDVNLSNPIREVVGTTASSSIVLSFTNADTTGIVITSGATIDNAGGFTIKPSGYTSFLGTGKKLYGGYKLSGVVQNEPLAYYAGGIYQFHVAGVSLSPRNTGGQIWFFLKNVKQLWDKSSWQRLPTLSESEVHI